MQAEERTCQNAGKGSGLNGHAGDATSGTGQGNGEGTCEGGASVGDPALLTWRWWAARVVALQQRTLSGPAACLQAELEQLTPQASPRLDPSATV